MIKSSKYRVQFSDGREEVVTVDGRDYMFYEKESGENALDLIEKGNSFETWYISTAAAMRRQGTFDGSPEDFYEAVTFVVPIIDKKEPAGEAPDPTTPPEGSENS